MFGGAGDAAAADLHLLFASGKDNVDQTDFAQFLEDSTRLVAEAGGLRHPVERLPENVRQETDQNMKLNPTLVLMTDRADFQVTLVVTVHGAARAVFSAVYEGDSPIFPAETVDYWAKTPLVPRKLGQSPRERLPLVDPKRGLCLGELNVGMPELFGRPVGDVCPQAITALVARRPFTRRLRKPCTRFL